MVSHKKAAPLGGFVLLALFLIMLCRGTGAGGVNVRCACLPERDGAGQQRAVRGRHVVDEKHVSLFLTAESGKRVCDVLRPFKLVQRGLVCVKRVRRIVSGSISDRRVDSALAISSL